jgi:branched-chain amino acid transport system ATP-binding protein
MDGKDVSRLSALERARGGLMIVPQGRQLFPRLTVRENLGIIAQLLKMGPDVVDEALERFPILRERAVALAGVLSGGEQQMLAVTRALMTRPRVLLLDEMMTGLGPLIVDQLVATLESLVEQGIAILLAEPEIGQLARVTGRGYIMVRGEIVQTVEEGGPSLVDAYRRAIGMHA